MAAQPTGVERSPLPAEVVGNVFVDSYYHYLQHSPDMLHRGAMILVTTTEAINQKLLLSTGYVGAEMKTVDAQESFGDGVTVLVTGYLTGEDNVKRSFIQSFFLAPQDNGFFVLNDIFRFVEEAEHQQLNQGLANGNAEPHAAEEALPPQQEEQALDQTISVEDEVLDKEEVYKPSENGLVVEEEEPIAEVMNEVPCVSPVVVVESSPVTGQEDMPKKSYASILQKNAIRKQIPPFKKFEQTERKTDEVEKQCSMLEQEDSKADEVEKQNSRSEQEDSKADEVEKHSSRWEQENSKATEKMSKEAISGNVGLPECKFYKTSGRCKYGKSCKYTHSLKKIEAAPIALNFLGLPIRPGEKECPYYMHTGNCKYAANCKYHHPEPTVAILEQGALPVCQIGGSEQQIPFGASPLPVTPSPTQGAFYVPTPSTVASPAYFSESHLHPPGLPFPSNSECNGYQHIHPDKHPKRHGKSRPSVHQKRGVQI